MNKQEEITDLLSKIKRKYAAGEFEKYIEYIRFPHFKNLAENTKIVFDFPFTVFTGLNGSGKSSALHAIFGAPNYYNTGNYWFSTQIDPINDSEARSCHIHGYKNGSGTIVEAIKQRIGTKKGADYWEPARPIKKYGMVPLDAKNRGRNPAIEKKVIYLDFRAELSAFDQFFYFGKFKASKIFAKKQDSLRYYSKYIKEAIDNNTVITYRTSRTNKIPEQLVPNTVKTIARILGKTYDECILLVHNFYGPEGLTAYFRTKGGNYSEAYAGRGEFAVVKLVSEVINAEKYSLILLDEPEVSLHPGAQEELKIFLLQNVLAKKLQVIISTHAPKFVEYLPDEAIKLFLQDASYKFIVKPKCNYLEAFQSIGVELREGDKNIIIVEDSTAKLIVDRVLKELGSDYILLFNVKFFPGGSDVIYKKAVGYAEEDEKYKFILLDGDQRKDKFNPTTFTQAEAVDFNFIKSKVEFETGIRFETLEFRVNGVNGSGDVEQKIQGATKYLHYLYTNMGYLPGNIPEEMLWDEEYVIATITLLRKAIPTFTANYKKNIMAFAEALFGDKGSNSVESAKKILLGEMIAKNSEVYQNLVETLVAFKGIVDSSVS